MADSKKSKIKARDLRPGDLVIFIFEGSSLISPSAEEVDIGLVTRYVDLIVENNGNEITCVEISFSAELVRTISFMHAVYNNDLESYDRSVLYRAPENI